MHHLRRLVLLPVWLVMLVLAGCQTSEVDVAEPAIFTDALGRQVVIPETIGRVVTLAPGVTELVAAAGALDKIVGVSTADDYPPAVVELPQFSALPVNFEAVAALAPDIIFATTQVNNHRDADVFSTLNIPIVYLASNSLEDVLQSILSVGTILETADVATENVSALRARVQTLQEFGDAEREKPEVLFLISAQALHSFGPESYVHDLIELAGGTSSTAVLDVENPILSDEFVLTQDPDIIVGTFGDSFSPNQLLEYHPTWTVVSAIANNRVYSIESDLVLRAGPRIVDAAEELSSMLRNEQSMESNIDR